MHTKVFVMTHKKIAEIPDDMYIPLHVGREGKEDFGYLGDNTGEHISSKNNNYCELTGLYWLWKNFHCDVIGICHYRRYFIHEEQLITKEKIEELLSRYDIIIPNGSSTGQKTTYEQYAEIHCSGKDLDVCREVIAEKYPEYVQAFDVAMQSALVSIGNMWITRKDIYDRYCEWLFDILFEVEKRIDISTYDDYQKRVMGFLSERLFRVWLLMQSERITEVNIKMIAPEDFDNAEKKISLIYRYVNLKLQPMLELYQTNKSLSCLIDDMVCHDDFENKIPVWVCWWQGEKDMPEVVRMCYESLKRNIPSDKMTIRLITLENCLEYVTFTDSIIQKFNDGIISYTQLSDGLRAELLYRYGGMWIDATYYVTKMIPEFVYNSGNIYTLRYKTAHWKSDITAGRWAGNLWCVDKGNILFQFFLASYWYYWETEDKLIDYYLIDYIIAVAVENIPEVKEQLEACIWCEDKTFLLQEIINKKADDDRMKIVMDSAVFYKLNRQREYCKDTIAGKTTVFGKLISGK